MSEILNIQIESLNSTKNPDSKRRKRAILGLPTGTPKTMGKIFIEIKAKAGEHLNPFLLTKLIESKIGKITSGKSQGNTYVIEASEDAIPKINGQIINNIEIEASRHVYLNKSKGTIYSPGLNYVDTTEIEQELAKHGVAKVTRFLKKGTPSRGEKGTENERGVVLMNTGVYLLEFNKPSRPEFIDLCFERLKVRTYYPNPKPCNNCGKTNHNQHTCRNPKLCLKCGELYNDQHICIVNPKCINCCGDHPAFSRSCPELQKEKLIIKYAIDNNISRSIARKRIQTSPTTSYANAIRNGSEEEIQTLKNQIHQLQSLNETLLRKIKFLTTLSSDEEVESVHNGTPTIELKNNSAPSTSRPIRRSHSSERNRSSDEQSPGNRKPKKQKKSNQTNRIDINNCNA